MEQFESFRERKRPSTSVRSKGSSVSTSMSRHSRAHRSHSARPGYVPAVPPNPLEIHSSPIHLATRSLSARSAASSLISSGSLSSKHSSRSMPPRQGTQGRKQVHNTSSSSAKPKRITHNGRTLHLHKDMGSSGKNDHTKGFNVARDIPGEVDHSDGSLSPDMDQFLHDVASTPLATDSNQPTCRLEIQSEELFGAGNERVPQRPSQGPKPHITATITSDTPTNSVPRLKFVSEAENQSTKQDTLSDSHIKPSPARECSENMEPNVAATRIQQWYRETREKHHQAQVQSLLREKRDELNQSKLNELKRIQLQVEDREHKEIEKQKRREAKMQAARKAAIEGLQKKREEKRQEAERIAQEEIALLQASGKIKKGRSQKKTKKSVGRGEQSTGATAEGEKEEGSKKDDQDQIIEDFFKAGSSRQHQKPTPVSDDPPKPPTTITTTTQQPSNTYSDLMETLKLLEEPPAPLNPDTNANRGSYLSADNLRTLDPSLPSTGAQGGSTGLTDSKLQSIITYLDEIEKSDEDMLTQISKSRLETRTVAVPTPASVTAGNSVPTKDKGQEELDKKIHGAPLPSELDAATAVASDVTATILTQRMELENKSKTVEMLQKALIQQRELTVYHAKQMEKEGQKRLKLQKEEYDAAIQRHQCFIDQLIEDKKVLSERCEQLVKELKELDKKYKTKIKTLEETYKAEVTKLKQVSAATDKLRREKWQTEETQRIKEATVKSLEPEIQRIIAKGKSEIQKLKALHEAEMMQVDERASRRFVSQMEELRAQCAQEKEQACSHERELARQRYEKLTEQEEIKYQQQRRKLFSEVQTEKEKLASEFHQKKTTLELQMDELQREHEKFVMKLKSEHAQELEEAERRSGIKMRDLQDRIEIEKQAWEENLLKKQDADIMSRERELREQLRQERDREIEMVISRLEEETATSKEETERTAEVRIQRLKDKYEAEVREVERSERNTLEKFSNMKMKTVELEGDVSRLRSLLTQKEQEVKQVSEVASKLTKERDNVTDIVRQEFADRLVSTEEENKQLKIEMSELRARQKIEVERVGRLKEKELGDVHERVKQALSKKDENIKSLRAQYEAVLKRADHLEMLLERQRKELLKK